MFVCGRHIRERLCDRFFEREARTGRVRRVEGVL